MAITINSTAFENAFYPAISRAYLFGNVGDEITVTINFTTATTPITAAKFSFGLIENNTDEYPDSPTYEIPFTLFQNQQTGEPQTFSGNVGVLNANNPISWNTGTCSFADLGSNIYEITHTFILSPIFQESQLDVQPPAIPAYFLGGKCLRYIYDVALYDVLVNPTPQETTRGTDLTTQFALGNTGFFGEFYNTGTNNYSLLSQSYSVNPNSTESSNVTGQIQTSAGAFDTLDDFVLVIGFVPNELAQDETYTDNYQLERIPSKADGVPVSGTLAFNMMATVNTDTSIIDYFFQIPALTNTNVFWYMQVSTDSTAEQNENIWGNFLAVETGATISAITILKPDGSSGVDDFRFYKWLTFDVSEGHNHLKAFRNDDIHANWRIDTGGADISLVTFGIKNKLTNQVINGESFSFAPSALPLLIPRNFERSTSNVNAEIRVQELTTGVYSFFYGFQVWTDFVQDNLVLFCRIDAGDDTIEFQSPDFEIGQYAITQNGIGEPQVLPAPTDPIIYNLADASGAIVDPTNIGGIIRGENTYIKATFTDENLNDLQRLQSELRGYFNLLPENGGQSTVRAFFDEYDSETSTPWQEVVGHTAGRAKVTKVDVKTVTLEAVLIWTRLTSNFTSDQLQTLCVIPRMDSIDSFVFTTKFIGFHFRGGELTELTFQLTEATPDASILEIFGGVATGSLAYYYNTSDIWPPSTQYTLADFKNVIATANVGDWIRLTTSATGFVDGFVVLQYVTATATTTPFALTVNLVRGVDNEFALPLIEGLQLNSVTGVNVTDVQGKAVADTPFIADYMNMSQGDLIASVASINTELNAVSGVNSALLINANYANNLESGSVTINGTFDNSGFEYAGISDSFILPQFRSALGTECKVYDGTNDYDLISGWDQTQFNVDTPFTMYIVCYISAFTSDSSGSRRIFSTGGLLTGASGTNQYGEIELSVGQTGSGSFFDLRLNGTGGSGKALRTIVKCKLGFNLVQITNDGTRALTGINMYVNGVSNEYTAKTSTLSGNTTNPFNHFIIGKYSLSTAGGLVGRRFNGYIQQMTIADYEQTAQELRQDFVNGVLDLRGNNAVLDVDFDQTGAAAPIDNGVNSYTIVPTGTAAYTPYYGL